MQYITVILAKVSLDTLKKICFWGLYMARPAAKGQSKYFFGGISIALKNKCLAYAMHCLCENPDTELKVALIL